MDTAIHCEGKTDAKKAAAPSCLEKGLDRQMGIGPFFGKL
jgi:hypothetical protein